MRPGLLCTVLGLALAACGQQPASSGATASLAPDGSPVARTWGAPLADAPTVPVSTLLASPDAYVGKTVRVRGTAVAVCQHRGCWFDVASDVEGQTLRFKVDDGDMVFPPDLVGETVLAEGVFTANPLDLETTKKVCAQEAAAEGRPFDATQVTECMTLYQLSGRGVQQVARSE
ncbi:MAG: DUF4920 domain-containing protein [Planctomycetes bacterium]|nr:DUF4920 domain-containing protein [Planctomycetota bacterium]